MIIDFITNVGSVRREFILPRLAPWRLRRRERTALLSVAAEDSVLAKQLSDEGTEDYRQDRADWLRLPSHTTDKRLPDIK
jgi:hypothetical protein